jgi:outer membrane protein assembly factor BamB
MDFGRVYRYRGDSEWEDIGQPGENHRLNSLASYRGKLYICAFNIGKPPGHCYVHEGGNQWRPIGEFDGMPHTMAVHDGKLYAAYPRGEVFAYDGERWENLGNPFGSTAICSQVHCMGVHKGELHVGTWPLGRIGILRHGKWVDGGRPGDATEVIGLATYNGMLYAGTIPRAEVFRLNGSGNWQSMRKLFAPEGFEPVSRRLNR